MSYSVILLCCLSFILGIHGKIYKENITDFSKCKIHISRSEGSYTIFYAIYKDSKPENDSLLFDFHFSVLARSDAHILLAENNVVQGTDPVYEIVIGAGDNTFTEVRRLQKSAGKVSARIRGLLSTIDIRSFWIHVWNDGLVEVGKEGEELAFLAWTDPDPLNLKYFSFSTWPGVEAKWFFNCERKIITKESETILTDSESLKRDLFQNYSIFIRPVLNESDMTDVELNLIPQYISLDVGSSKLSMKGLANMKWIDKKLTWNPDDYGKIKSLKLPSHRVWTPDLQLYNQQVDLQDVVLYSNGSVFCNIFLDVTYWCNIEDLSSWPSDIHTCSLRFHLMRDADKIRLYFLSKMEDFFSLPRASEWTVANVDVKYELDNESLDYVYDDSPSITFLVTIKRTSNIYKLIFLPPFFVISICSVCTFLSSPLGYTKIALCCIQLIMESIILIGISTIIPGHSTRVPTLIVLYSSSLTSTAILVIMSIIVINLTRNEYDNYSMPRFVHYILSSNLLQSLLFITNIEKENNYGKLSDSPIQSKENTAESVWIVLGKVLDRIGFAVYSVLFIFAVSQKY